MSQEYKLLVHSARQVVQVVRKGELFLRGSSMRNVAVLQSTDSQGCSIVVSRDGNICDIGHDAEIKEKYDGAHFDRVINAAGKCVLPGFVDAHTHPVWAGDRVKEFSMKLSGASYMDLHRVGGGIYYTVEQTRQATEDELFLTLRARLRGALQTGTTLLEAKSGYGLEAESELKMLRVLERAKKEGPMEISSTFCGAHAVPKHLTSSEATDAILREQIPALSKSMEAGEVAVENIDVFCEKGVFDVHQSKRILEAGRALGLRINFHGDELNPTGSAEMGAELGAEAISHLEEISEEGIAAMAESQTFAVILPTTAYMLKLKPPPVRRMIEAGVPIALGSDFNPNAFCYSMATVMHLACVVCGMTMEEALVACTLNGAATLGRSRSHGSLERGKIADLLIINAPRWEHIIYQMGAPTINHCVIKKGDVVYENHCAADLI